MKLSLNKELMHSYTSIRTEGAPLEVAPIPSYVRIPLLSAKNKMGVPLVKSGDFVEEGQAIGQADNFYFYTGISGSVCSVQNEEMRFNNTTVLRVPIVEIRFSGKIKNWQGKKYDYLNRSVEELKQEILRMGVEHSNPTSCFSMEDILNVTKNCRLIVTALEIAPMVTFGQEILLQYQEEIHTALSILEYIIAPNETKVVVHSSLKNRYSNSQRDIEYLDISYPEGYESLLFKRFTGVEDSTEQIIKESRYVFIDIQTLYHIYNAVILKKPFIEQFVTIDGKVAQYPGHYLVRIGSNIGELIENIGFFKFPKKIVSRNILSADIVYNLDLCIYPLIYSLFLLDEDMYRYRRFEDCIQCGLCLSFCPVDIFPYELAQAESPNQKELDKCIRCMVCSAVCPAHIPLGYFLDLQREQ